MIGAVELVADRNSKAPLTAAQRIPFRIAHNALDKGVLIRPLGNVLYFVPAFIVTNDQINTMMEVTKVAIREIVYG
jgi:adenosylmethionine-8-amino-7-oxononanoate aminotransferase